MTIAEPDLEHPSEGAPTRKGGLNRHAIVLTITIASALVLIRGFVSIDPYWKLASIGDDPTPVSQHPPVPLPGMSGSDEIWNISGAVLDQTPDTGGIELVTELPALDESGLTPEPKPTLDVPGRANVFGEKPQDDVPPLEPVTAERADAHIAAYRVAKASEIEESMHLKVAVRREVQRRLSLFGYNTAGIDGALGTNSRAAISAWQQDYGFPNTGYLNDDVLNSIRERTQVVWEEWHTAEAERAAAARRATKTAPREKVLAVPDDGCKRSAEGEIIADQSIRCDFKRTRERIAGFLGGEPSRVELSPAGAER